MSGFPKISFIFDRYKKASRNKSAVIELRISYNRKQKYISTGIQLFPKEWENGMVINRPDARSLNQMLDNLLFEIRQILMEMQSKDEIDIFAVPLWLKRRHQKQISLFDFIKQRSEVRKYGKSEDTKIRYDRFYRLFKEWGKIKSFEDITEANIIAYDQFLSSSNMKPNSKWNNYHRFLNSFIMDAIDAGLMKKNPYKWINIDKRKETMSLQRCLTPEEFHRLEEATLPTACLTKVRDLFVFQTFTCLSYTDLQTFDASKIVEVEGMKVYMNKRQKTGKDFTIPLLPPALHILEKYHNQLPVISNVKYNQYLKIVAQAVSIDKPVSTHYARHTGATLLLNSGVPMLVVSKICGHSSTKMTEQVYAKVLDETIVKAIKKVIGK